MNTCQKIRRVLSVYWHSEKCTRQISYYPNEPRKSEKEILRDQIRILWKYGETEPFYFTYGFDRKEMTWERMTSEYILPYHVFERKINKLNFQNPRYDDFHGKLTGRVITGDKFYFNIFLEHFGIPTPKIYLYIKDQAPLFMDGQFVVDKSLSVEDQLRGFFSHDMDAFAKPADGQLGNGIFALRIEEGKIYMDNKGVSMQDLIRVILSADYLVQERIYQHPKMAELCSSTINSIRLQTVMDKDGNVIPFGAMLRIGRSGGSVDNWAKGGILVGIDMENAKLKNRGILKPSYGTTVFEHPDTKMVFKDREIPYYKEAEYMAVRLHKYLYRCHSIGWDIAITEKGPVFIEGNGLWEISMPQAVHGGMKDIEKYF